MNVTKTQDRYPKCSYGNGHEVQFLHLMQPKEKKNNNKNVCVQKYMNQNLKFSLHP